MNLIKRFAAFVVGAVLGFLAGLLSSPRAESGDRNEDQPDSSAK